MVPPVMKSTPTPVSCVNFLAAVSATRSRQLPPHMLTMSLSCPAAGSACSAKEMTTARIEMRFIRQPPDLHASPGIGAQQVLARTLFIGDGRVDEITCSRRGPCAPAPMPRRSSVRARAPFLVKFLGRSSGGVPPRSSSNREIAVASYGIGGERTRGARPHDTSLFQDDVAVRETQQRFDGLVDDEDRQAI